MDESMEFVIRARDEATRVLQDFKRATDSLGTSMESVENRSSSLQMSLGGVTGALVALAGAYAAIKGGEAVFSYLNESADKFLKLEMEKRLNATLKDSARQIEIATNIDEGQIRGVMRSAQESFDPSQIEDVTKAAIGLSYELEISLAEAFQKVKAATDGSFSSIEYLIPGLKDLTSAQDRLAAVSAFASEGLKGQTEKANSGLDVFAKFAIETENLATTIGEMVAPFKQLAYEGIAIVVEFLNQALQPAIEDFQAYFSGMAMNVQANAKAFAEVLVGAFTFVEVGVTNIGTVMEMAGASIMLTLEQWRSTFEHVLVTVIPEYVMWFGRNFLNILQDTAVAASHLVENLGRNIINGFSIIFEYIMGGWQDQDFDSFMAELGGAMSENLLRGFEPVTEALPEVGERAVSDFEKSLEGVLTEGGEKLANDFTTKFEERMAALNDSLQSNPIETDVQLNMRSSGFDLQSQQVKALNAFESRVMVSGDVSNSPEKSTAENTGKMAKTIDEVLQVIKQPKNRPYEQQIEIVGVGT